MKLWNHGNHTEIVLSQKLLKATLSCGMWLWVASELRGSEVSTQQSQMSPAHSRDRESESACGIFGYDSKLQAIRKKLYSVGVGGWWEGMRGC